MAQRPHNPAEMAAERDALRVANHFDEEEYSRPLFPLFPPRNPDEISYGIMPLGEADVRAIARATGYSVTAVRALARIYAKGGLKASGGAAFTEGLRIAGAGWRNAVDKAQKLRAMLGDLHVAVRKLAPEAAHERWPAAVPPQAPAPKPRLNGRSGKTPTTTPEAERAQQWAVTKLANEKLRELRTENTPAENPVRAAGRSARDKVTPPSVGAVARRAARADAKLPPEAQKAAESLRKLAEKETKPTTLWNSKPLENSQTQGEVLNRTVPQHIPEPMTEKVAKRAMNDAGALRQLIHDAHPETVREVPPIKRTAKPVEGDASHGNLLKLGRALRKARGSNRSYSRS